MEIDKKQFQAVMKDVKGKGRHYDYYERGYRHGIDDAYMFVKRLSSGWQYTDGEWIAPQSKDKP